MAERTKIINLRLSENELSRIQNTAKMLGLSTSAYIRLATLSHALDYDGAAQKSDEVDYDDNEVIIW